MTPSSDLENKTLSDTYWRVQLVCIKAQYLRITTGIRSGPDAFDESRFVMTSLAILWVTQILCSFRLVLEGETGKEIPQPLRLEFLEKFFAKKFALSDAEDNTSGPFNRGGIADLSLLRTILAVHQKSRKPSFWEVMNSYLISISMFGSFKSPFGKITSLSGLYFRFRRFSLLVQTKKVISVNYGSSTSS